MWRSYRVVSNAETFAALPNLGGDGTTGSDDDKS